MLIERKFIDDQQGSTLKNLTVFGSYMDRSGKIYLDPLQAYSKLPKDVKDYIDKISNVSITDNIEWKLQKMLESGDSEFTADNFKILVAAFAPSIIEEMR